MTNGTRSISIASMVMVLSAVAYAQDATVLTTNYDIKLAVDNQQYRVHSRALVRSGNEIPNLLQDFKVGLRVFDTLPDDFLIQVIVYERNGSGWHQITVPPPEFSGKLGIPTNYVWESAGMKLDVAIVAGIHRR